MTDNSLFNPVYDKENIFAKILKGEIPNHTIYEDNETLAFLDVMPASSGHSLVIPKTPAVNLTDITTESLLNLMTIVKKIAPGIVKAMGADGFIVQQLSGRAAGQTVFHIHFHIIPQWQDKPTKRHGTEMASSETLAEQASLIRNTLSEKQGS